MLIWILVLYFTPTIILGIVAFTFLTGIIGGCFVAFNISKYSPIDLIRDGGIIHTKDRQWLRNSLVVLQFVISIALISSTLVINDQMNFMQQKDLGFDKEQILVAKTNRGLDAILSTPHNSRKT